MADDGSGAKTEEPTPKKLEDARKKGQVWRSRDLASTAVFIAAIAAMAVTIPGGYARLQGLFADSFARVQSPSAEPSTDIAALLQSGLIVLAALCLPPILAGATSGSLADFLLVGPVFTQDPLSPKLDRLNPLQGLKNLLSTKQLVELAKSTIKLLLAGYLAYRVMKSNVGLIALTPTARPDQIATVVGHLVYELTKATAMLLVVISIFDVWWQRRVYMKDLMMTKEEVKREYKESEGDPTHKAKRREMHQEILESNMIEDVRTADVIVTNPDHIAVALKYKKDEDQAPRVVAKGMNITAERIKEVAREAGVPVMRNVALAHSLNQLEIGDEIPEELYDAVAEVLNFVYKMAKP
jgi:flagellar biosynthesis protein FlhB